MKDNFKFSDIPGILYTFSMFLILTLLVLCFSPLCQSFPERCNHFYHFFC